MDNKMKKTIQFTVMPRNTKCLEINLRKASMTSTQVYLEKYF